ncbi:hypothetical protein [Microbulbifer sp. 2205BS26-8]|uniref:hypothetical protein n=1 Tax=Microbulbifer sp. 2205BS26-8 TaxID=3064386 RepID=UPI00273D6938|nr:hypothetical protein [Microbulbifer sp. 2205BS26-8]MDP5209847.1 hypothetical protein [Microbulbifer sp. 2205BS26-8]
MHSANQPVFTIISHLDNGEIRTVITEKRSRNILLALLILVLFLVGIKALSIYERNYQLRPQMTELADSGQDAAALWLVQHFYAEEKGRLPALVLKGLPEAIYTKGRMAVIEGDRAAGEALIAQAAAQGFAPAIQYTKTGN